MKLYIDDIRNAPDSTWLVARTITEAIRTIDRFASYLTEISLDHDISHQVVVDGTSRPYPCGENFSAVAYFIAQKYKYGDLKYPNVTLHTSNPVGAENMRSILSDSGLECEIKLTGAVNRLEMEV